VIGTFVARVTRLVEETVTFTELEDIRDAIYPILGADVWQAILEFTQGKNEKLESKLENLEEDLEKDEKVIQLDEEAMKDIKDKIGGLTEYINNSKRLDKRGLKKKLEEIDFILYNRL